MIPVIWVVLSVFQPVVQTDAGALRGASSGTVWSFKNIPYAAPPVGEFRWRPPRPAAPWEGRRDATQWGDKCTQIDSSGNLVGGEDCLQLNVFTPAAPSPVRRPGNWPRRLRPVLVWIHGGSLTTGSAVSLDGTRLVQKTGVVLVTINYRLGPLGYMAHAALTWEQQTRTTGNYGLLDQIAALEWVHRNIAQFGGDPDRVTVFGQSAGAFSVCSLVASPLAAGLLSGAIMMSGSCSARTLTANEVQGNAVFAYAGCSQSADPPGCMRALPAGTVVRIPVMSDYASPVSGYSATIDGYALRGDPQTVIAQGHHNHMPVIVGNTSNELGASTLAVANEADFRNAIWQLVPYPGAYTLIAPQYTVAEYSSYRDAYVAFASDLMYVWPARGATRAFLAGQTEPVWRYVFSHVKDNAGPEIRAQGAVHSADTPYIFDTLDRGDYTPSEGERGLIDVMQRLWARMAETGAPEGGDLPFWPRYTTLDPYLRLDTPAVVEAGFRRLQCDFWDYMQGIKPN